MIWTKSIYLLTNAKKAKNWPSNVHFAATRVIVYNITLSWIPQGVATFKMSCTNVYGIVLYMFNENTTHLN